MVHHRRVSAVARQLCAPVAADPVASDVGIAVEELDTPALIVDLDAVEANIKTMSTYCQAKGAVWRPHCKAIRSPALAQKMIDAGAVGITCAKISQAAAMVDGGIRDVLIANEIIGKRKIASLIELAHVADTVCVACDDQDNMREIAEAASRGGVVIHVLVDVNIGMDRCGIHSNNLEDIVALSKLATELSGVEYRGIMGYDGHAQAFEGKLEQTTTTAQRLTLVKEALDKAGVEVPLFSGAGSGNYYVSLGLGLINEVQAGGGIFNCKTYMSGNEGYDGAPPMRPALFLQAQIVSVANAADGYLIGDAGFKSAFPFGGDLPMVVSHDSQISVDGVNAEHTIFRVQKGAALGSLPKLGDRVIMIPVYSDATVLLHSHMYAVRAGVVEAVWPLQASIGRVQ